MKRILIILPILVMMIFTGCTIKEPGSPSWDIELTIPIADRVYPLSDIIDDSTTIADLDSVGNWISSSGDSLFINYADSIEPVVNTDSLVADSINHSTQSLVGDLIVNAPGSESTIFLLQEIDPTLQPGFFPIFPNDLDPDTSSLAPYDEFDWIRLSSKQVNGQAVADTNEVTITLSNNLPFPLEDMTIQLWGKSPNVLLYEAFFEGIIDPEDSRIVTDTLSSSDSLDNEMYIDISGSTPGTGGTFVNITTEDNINIAVDLSPLVVQTAAAHIISQSFDTLSYFTIESEDEIISATIREAYIDYTLTNNTGLYNIITFTIPDFVDEFGESFGNTIYLPPDSFFTAEAVDLSNYILLTDENQIYASVVVNIIDSYNPTFYAEPYAEVEANQSVDVTFSIYNHNNPSYKFAFKSFEANLLVQTNEIEPTTLEIGEMPEGLDSLQVAQAILDLYLTSTIGVSVPMEVELFAYRDGIEKASLIKQTAILAGAKNDPVTTVVSFDDAADLINAFPDSIKITGRYHLGGQIYLEDENFNGAYVEGYYILHAPFSMSAGATSLEPELTEIDNGFDNQLISADLTMNLISHFPMTGNAYILACKDSAEFNNPLSTEIDTFFNLQLPTARVDTITGYVITPGARVDTTILNQDQLDLFASASAEEPLFIKTLITINSNAGMNVNFSPDDYISVGASGHFILNVDFSDEGGN